MNSVVMLATPMPVSHRLRLVTYNIRKGKGADGRSAMLSQIGPALGSHAPDLLLCQEVFHCRHTGLSQSADLAEALGLGPYYGANKFRRVGHHGNTTFTSLGVEQFTNHDISTNFIERRGALYTRVMLDGQRVHVINAHLGLNERQRLTQVQRIWTIVNELCGEHEPVVIAGDFNDWNGRLDRAIVQELGFVNAFHSLGAADIKTWHSRRPLFSLDRVYVRNLKPVHVECLIGAPWDQLSDHLPLVAELELM